MSKKFEIVSIVVINVMILILIGYGLYRMYWHVSELEPPAWQPEVEVTVLEPDLMQPGVTIFGVNQKASVDSRLPSYFGYDQNGELVWYYANSEDTPSGNYDLELMPDGNYLIHIDNGWRVITPEGKTKFEVTADDLAAKFGYDEIHHDVTFTPEGNFIAIATETRHLEVAWFDQPAKVKGEVLIEVDQEGDIIWEWNSFDYLDTDRLPLKQALQQNPNAVFDWLHANGLQYFAEDDSILVSFRHQSWVIKIDHATGEVLWRLGRDGDFELVNRDPATKVSWFSAQHAPELHADGTILIYDNGNERGWTDELYSRAVIYQLDEQTMTARQTWQYQTDYYTDFVGDVDLLENGNVLVTAGGQRDHQGPAQIIEVTQDQPAQEVWKIEIPDYDIFRATRLLGSGRETGIDP